MPIYPPIIRCVMLLCFGAAGFLVAAEWQGWSLAGTSEQIAAAKANLPVAQPQHQRPWDGFWSWLSAQRDRKSEPTASTVRLVVKLSQRRVEVYDQKKLLISYPIAVGQAEWPTPTGEFKVFEKITDPVWQHPITGEEVGPGIDNPLGSRWIGFWTDDRHRIGFHGTNKDDLIGQAVSHGCVRMRDQDIRSLFDKVEVGTTVTVEP